MAAIRGERIEQRGEWWVGQRGDERILFKTTGQWERKEMPFGEHGEGNGGR